MRDSTKELFDAIRRRDVAGVLAAIAYGADVNARDHLFDTPLHALTRSDPVLTVGEDDMSAQVIAQALLDAGAHVDAADQFGETALIRALEGSTHGLLKDHEDVEVAFVLVGAGACLDVHASRSPPCFAVVDGDTDALVMIFQGKPFPGNARTLTARESARRQLSEDEFAQLERLERSAKLERTIASAFGKYSDKGLAIESSQLAL